MWPFRSGKRVLTIGSVHLDTIALSHSPATLDVTDVGSITHSVGGSAYNIAANLASQQGEHGAIRDIAIYSILPQHSVLTEIIRYKIKTAGASSRFIRQHREFKGKRVRGGGYVGVLNQQDRLIRAAVVDAAMHEANIFLDKQESAYLEQAVGWADMLSIDADLAVSTVNHIADHSRDNDKPLFVSVGSPTAGMRSWIHGHDENIATCLSGRLLVLRSILEQLKFPETEIDALREFVETGEQKGAFDVNEICRRLKTRNLLCCNVQKSRGFALLAAGKTPHTFFFATPGDVRSRVQQGNSAGVMDGAMAGFIQSCAQRTLRRSAADEPLISKETQKLFHTNIVDLVGHVSESEGATPGSVISFEEQDAEQSRLAKLWRLTKIANDVLPVFKYLLSLAGFIIALWIIDVGLDLMRYLGYEISLPDRPWLRTLLRR